MQNTKPLNDWKLKVEQLAAAAGLSPSPPLTFDRGGGEGIIPNPNFPSVPGSCGVPTAQHHLSEHPDIMPSYS